MDTEKLIETLRKKDPCDECEDGGCITCEYRDYRKKAADFIESALRAQAARENPKPLTLEELMTRKGLPVWYQPTTGKGWWTIFSSMNDEPRVIYFSNHYIRKMDYGKKAVCFDHEPKGE